MHRRMTTSVPWRAVVALLLLGVFLLAGCGGAEHEFAGAVIDPPQLLPDFTLTTGGDTPVSLSDFRGEYVYIYFGYTFCPDFCPTTMSALTRARRELGDDADRMRVIMVTVDPERDTPDVIANYVRFFDPSYVGLTGTPAEIAAAGEPFGVFYQKHEGSAASGYLVDHSTRTYLIDPEGNYRVAYPYETTPEQFVEDLRWLIGNES